MYVISIQHRSTAWMGLWVEQDGKSWLRFMEGLWSHSNERRPDHHSSPVCTNSGDGTVQMACGLCWGLVKLFGLLDNSIIRTCSHHSSHFACSYQLYHCMSKVEEGIEDEKGNTPPAMLECTCSLSLITEWVPMEWLWNTGKGKSRVEWTKKPGDAEPRREAGLFCCLSDIISSFGELSLLRLPSINLVTLWIFTLNSCTSVKDLKQAHRPCHLWVQPTPWRTPSMALLLKTVITSPACQQKSFSKWLNFFKLSQLDITVVSSHSKKLAFKESLLVQRVKYGHTSVVEKAGSGSTAFSLLLVSTNESIQYVLRSYGG